MHASRRLNDGMGAYVANQTIKCMNKQGVLVKDAKILILGFTFKENCPDIRNTKVVDVYHTLSEYTHNITVYDPWADSGKAEKEYGLHIVSELPDTQFDAVILAVAHRQFENLDLKKLVCKGGVVYDVKGVLPREVVNDRL
jgi:UDP-N-acetyl-D-galactosamine dehydrogenase